MYCRVLHFEFIKDGHNECPFCNEKLEDTKSIKSKCCDRPNLINDSPIVCTNCGTVNDYLTANEFVDFYENMYRIRRKSVYHRKDHILNVIDDMTRKNQIQISYNNRDKILRIFALIDQIVPEVNTSRMIMISIWFILRQLFRALGIEYKFIPLSKSKKTLKYYNQL